MADQWFYRVFDEQFGPVPYSKLKELASCGTLSSSDHVRSVDDEDWTAASSMEQLWSSDESSTSPTAAADTELETDPQSGSSGNDDWYVRLEGHEYGPWTFEELTQYAANRELGADDEVKLGESGKWRRVGSIGRLMAALPYTPVQKNIVPSAAKPAGVTRRPAEGDDEYEDGDEFVDDEEDEGEEFEDNEQEEDGEDGEESAAEKEEQEEAVHAKVTPAKNGPETKPALPVISARAVAQLVAKKTEEAFYVAFEQAKAKIIDAILSQADATFKAAEDQAKSQVSWTTGSNVDRYWYGWASGVEFGPVEFNQVFGLAKSGQLKPTDFVRNGQFAQFAPSANVPGLFTAVAAIAKATETLNIAKAQAQAAAAAVGPPKEAPADLLKPTVAPNQLPASAAAAAPAIPSPPAPVATTGKSSPVISVVQGRTGRTDSNLPTMDPTAAKPGPSDSSRSDAAIDSRNGPSRGSPYSSGMSGSAGQNAGFGSSSTSVASMPGMSGSNPAFKLPNRPGAPAKKASPKQSVSYESTWLPELKEKLKDPQVIGAICFIAFIGLLFAWPYLPKSRGADRQKYYAIKQVLDDIKAKRSSAPTELKGLEDKLSKLGRDIAAELKNKAGRDDPAKQCLLWIARDEIPRFVRIGVGVANSDAEKSVDIRMRETSYELGIERRPPADPMQVARISQSDD